MWAMGSQDGLFSVFLTMQRVSAHTFLQRTLLRELDFASVRSAKQPMPSCCVLSVVGGEHKGCYNEKQIGFLVETV